MSIQSIFGNYVASGEHPEDDLTASQYLDKYMENEFHESIHQWFKDNPPAMAYVIHIVETAIVNGHFEFEQVSAIMAFVEMIVGMMLMQDVRKPLAQPDPAWLEGLRIDL